MHKENVSQWFAESGETEDTRAKSPKVKSSNLSGKAQPPLQCPSPLPHDTLS